jgi:hypothetical protein
MAVRRACGLLVVAWIALAAAPVGAAPKVLTGADIRSQVIGNTIAGEMGAAFTEFYSPDGAIRGSSADGAYQGKWSIQGDLLCLEYDEPLGCRRIALDGDQVTFITEQGQVDGTGTLLKGNPNHY